MLTDLTMQGGFWFEVEEIFSSKQVAVILPTPRFWLAMIVAFRKERTVVFQDASWYTERRKQGGKHMPTLCTVKGIKVYINWNDHMPPHFHALFAGEDVSIDIETLEPLGTNFPKRQLKIILGWAACHQQELMDNWLLIAAQETFYPISPEL